LWIVLVIFILNVNSSRMHFPFLLLFNNFKREIHILKHILDVFFDVFYDIYLWCVLWYLFMMCLWYFMIRLWYLWCILWLIYTSHSVSPLGFITKMITTYITNIITNTSQNDKIHHKTHYIIKQISYLHFHQHQLPRRLGIIIRRIRLVRN